MKTSFIHSMINCIVFCIYGYYSGTVIFEEKCNNKKDLIIGNILFGIIIMLVTLFFDSIVSNVIGCISFCIYFKKVFNKNGYLSCYSGMVVNTLRLIPKLIFMTIYTKYNNQICSYHFFACSELIINIVFSIIGFLILYFFRNSFRKLRDLFLINHNRLYIFLFVIFLDILLTTIVRIDYIVIDSNFMMDTIICIILMTFMVLYFKDDYKLDDLSNHYKEMCEYTELNDRLIDDYRMKLHDNKNHLLAIKSMTKDKKIKEYIDNLVDFENIDSEEYLNELNRIPSLSIRIFINYKLNKLRQLGTTIELVVSDNLEAIPTKDIPNLYTVIGIIMDNMIEYLSTVDNKLACIQLYKDNNHVLHAEFVNSYYGNINVNDLYKIGYSTKGIGRGVGLPIVKKIIDNNPMCSLDTYIEDNFFIQHIKIDLKKIVKN